MIGGLELPPPALGSSESAKVTFKALGDRYKIDVKVIDKVIALGFETLQEFSRVPKDKLEDLFVKSAGLGDMASLHLSRLVIAHEKVTAAITNVEVIDLEKSKEDDLDRLLPEPDLKTLKEKFHARYKLQYFPEDDPSEKVISRLAREFTKRDLSAKDLWAVQSLAARQKAPKSRREVLPGLSWNDEDVEFTGYRSASAFLQQLSIYMLGMAKAGVHTVSVPTTPELYTTQAWRVIFVPLDTCTRYVSRARRASDLVASFHRLSWVETQHKGDVEQWVYKFKNTMLPLGQIIEETMVERAVFWSPSYEITVEAASNSNAKGKRKGSPMVGKTAQAWGLGKGKGSSKGSGGGGKGASKGNSPDLLMKTNKRWLKQLHNGTWLCKEYQNNRCKNGDNCSMGKHLCGVEIKTGVACGKDHPATKCPSVWQR